MKWISTKDELPAYGEPVFIIVNGVVQNIAYMLNGADHVPDWFETYFKDSDLNLSWNEVEYWIYVDDVTLPEPMKVD